MGCIETKCPAVTITNDYFAAPDLNCCHNSIPAKALLVGGAVIIGAVKVVVFPILAVIGAILFPIIAAVRWAGGHEDATHYFQAGLLCLLGVAGVGSFMMLSAFTFPLLLSSAITMTAIVISITVHVYRACKQPALQAT